MANNGTDFMTRIQAFLSMDPKELVKKYPEVDPYKLLSQLQAGGAGMQQGGQPFAGAPTPDTGLLTQMPGVTNVQGGQGFKVPQENPWIPRDQNATNMADFVGAQPPGLKVVEGDQPLPAPAMGASGINPMLIASLGKALMAPGEGEQYRPQFAPTRPIPQGGGAPAKLSLAMPQLIPSQQQMLQLLMQRSLYG